MSTETDSVIPVTVVKTPSTPQVDVKEMARETGIPLDAIKLALGLPTDISFSDQMYFGDLKHLGPLCRGRVLIQTNHFAAEAIDPDKLERVVLPLTHQLHKLACAELEKANTVGCSRERWREIADALEPGSSTWFKAQARVEDMGFEEIVNETNLRNLITTLNGGKIPIGSGLWSRAVDVFRGLLETDLRRAGTNENVEWLLAQRQGLEHLVSLDFFYNCMEEWFRVTDDAAALAEKLAGSDINQRSLAWKVGSQKLSGILSDEMKTNDEIPLERLVAIYQMAPAGSEVKQEAILRMSELFQTSAAA